ncbi:ABC transporter ATP-binding protein [Shinella zoogloeoides]|uniref:ABC transporter ATP-binding protein n=1 Tax=Shinella zoogloeoides TaxID=352475 RepID=UPI0028A819AD|nr:ABC transporter ATP-binding protein [Shinella zoogloeoides]
MVVNAASLNINDVCKSFGGVQVISNVNIHAEPGEFLTFLGPSGCGKTTLLRMLGGFVIPDTGHIEIGGREVTGLPPNKRDCGFVFQSYALFPHMTVADNVGYGLKLRKVSKDEIARRTHEVLTTVGLDHLSDRYPKQLSGGQQQRVAIARGIAIRPQILLMDEPLSNLDAKLRERIRFELRALQQELGITTIFVTHDQEEAMAVSDRIVVLNKGQVEQIASPSEIYSRPSSHFVADFVGLNNIIEVEDQAVSAGGAIYSTTLGEMRAPVVDGAKARYITVRPEDMKVCPASEPVPSELDTVCGRVTLSAFLGPVGRYEVTTPDGTVIRAAAANSTLLPTGTEVVCSWSPRQVWPLSA